jgi:hypothetical protein
VQFASLRGYVETTPATPKSLLVPVTLLFITLSVP